LEKGRKYDTIEEFNFTFPLKGEFGNPKCIVPGKDGKPYSREGTVLDREEFERMKDEFYDIRGWDVITGFQKKEKLEALGLANVADGLENKDLLSL